MDQRIFDLYDSFTHGGISRRDFLDRLAGIAGSAAAAAALLPLPQAETDVRRIEIDPTNPNRIYWSGVAYNARIGYVELLN